MGEGEEKKYVKSRISLAFPKLSGAKLDKLLDTEENE